MFTASSIHTFNICLASLVFLPYALAEFGANSKQNLAVYWGQNSFGQASGPDAQQRLAHYCQVSPANIIPVSFLNAVVNPTTINLANAGARCSVFANDAQLLSCPEMEEDITSCQRDYGKTIMLSIGGATYTQAGFQSSEAAISAANMVWQMFGPVSPGSSVNRPFGSAVLDGFDFDFESSVTNMAIFGKELRRLMDLDGSKKYYLSAAPQCVYPDLAGQEMLEGAVAFDFIMVQYYNNWCGVQNFAPGSETQEAFNFNVWDNWARSVSKNPKVKILLGIPASAGAAGQGYTNGHQLRAAIEYSKQFPSFGGIMMWDMSQLYANPGFLGEVREYIA